MRLLITGGTGVLGGALAPLARAGGHELHAPGHAELDLFDPAAVAAAMHDIDAVLHLATRIQSLDRLDHPEAWRENDRLRADASRILVDAARALLSALTAPSGVYNVCRDGERVSNDRFTRTTGWQPQY